MHIHVYIYMVLHSGIYTCIHVYIYIRPCCVGFFIKNYNYTYSILDRGRGDRKEERTNDNTSSRQSMQVDNVASGASE